METPIQPTVEQFNSNPRSKELRDISLQLVERLIERVKGDPDPQIDTDIAMFAHKLDDMNIRANIHVGEPPEAFSDPVIMAEYVAGQLYSNSNSQDLIVMHSIRNVTLRFLDVE